MTTVREPLLDTVVGYFRSREATVVAVSDTTLSTLATGVNGTWTIFAAVREAERQLMVHSVLPVEVPEDRRDDVAQLLTRANFGMVIGNFEVDLDDGELRFKTSIDVGGGDLTESLVDGLMRANFVMMDRYLPGILAVVGGASPDQVIAGIEG